jgi:CubicO group peptidase (beta-lactamase class C family)
VVGLVAAGAMTVVAPAGAQIDQKSDVRARVDAVFKDFQSTAPGAAVAVARGDEIIFSATYGLADVERGVAITPETSFRLASVTKQFTAAAILTLVQARRLQLDDKLPDLLAGTPSYARDVSVRHLLTHTSGIPDYEPLLDSDDGPQIHDRDVLALLQHGKALYFAPGTSWRYSNSGYALLALIVEHVSGESFPAYLRRHVFDPAAMPTAVAHVEGTDVVANRAFGYSAMGTAWKRTDQSRTSAVLGDGGIYASAVELARWSASLDHNAVVGPESFREATTPVRLSSGAATSYGFGWFLDTHRGHIRHRHEGDSIGFRTAIQRYPDQRLTVIVLANRGAAPIDALSDGVANIFLDP